MLNSILQAAIKLEEEGIAFYGSAALKMSNNPAFRTFESFKKDEENHIKWLNGLSGDNDFADPDKEEIERLNNKLHSIFSDPLKNRKYRMSSTLDDIACFDIAITKEEESIEAYEDWAINASGESERRLFQLLVKVEKNYRQLLINAREYLNRTGDWFMRDEQWIFDGG